MKIGIVGATGSVGMEIIKVLAYMNLTDIELVLFSSQNKETIIKFDFEIAKTLTYIFLAVNNTFSLEWAEKLEASKVIVIDCSSAFRLYKSFPLVIPEINMNVVKDKYLIASPNCITSIALMALYPIHKKYRLRRVIISTYQAASGAGRDYMNEFITDLTNYPSKNTNSLICNLIPHIDEFISSGYTKEEMKVVDEMRKILDFPDLLISCTSVRVPTIRSHAMSITIETESRIIADDVRTLLNSSEGVDVVDDINNNLYPMPLTATNIYNIEVGRIRENPVFGKYGLDLFICGDQILRGAALNAVLIMTNHMKN